MRVQHRDHLARGVEERAEERARRRRRCERATFGFGLVVLVRVRGRGRGRARRDETPNTSDDARTVVDIAVRRAREREAVGVTARSCELESVGRKRGREDKTRLRNILRFD